MSKLEFIKERYNSVTSTVNFVQNSFTMYHDLRSKYRDKFMYTAVVEEDAFVYPDLMKYIDKKTKSRNFKFESTRDGVWRYYDSDSAVVFYIGEHKLKAELKKPGARLGEESAEDLYSGGSASFSFGGKDQLIFTARDGAGLQALQDLMEEFRASKQDKRRSVYIANIDSWGEWDLHNLPPKTMDSVFLPNGVKEHIIDDMAKFRANEEKFKIVGIPWHRGYAFYGEPGNGKSSIALALANHFEMDLYNLPLSTVRDDKTLIKCTSRLRPGTILLLEDIDIFSHSMKREQGDAPAPTLGGLLNALDGVATPHGLITIMTTNKFETLDPALIRPGRMDYKLELKAPVIEQVEGMFERVFDSPLNLDEVKQFSSMAAVVDVFKRNFEDEEAVRMELKNDN